MDRVKKHGFKFLSQPELISALELSPTVYAKN